MTIRRRIAQNVDAHLQDAIAGPWPDGYDAVYFRDTFNDGFDSWQDHSERGAGNTTTWYSPPLSLSTQRTFNNNKHALKLSTGTATTATQEYGGACTGYKRMARHHETGFILFGAWLAYRGVAEQAAPRSIHMGIDTQKWDNTSRAFPKAILSRWVGTAPDVFAPKWAIANDGGGTTDVPGAVAASSASPVAGQGSVMGWNENKSGFAPVGLVFNLDANGGVGGYHRLIVGPRVFDLTGLGAGRGAQPPQVTTEAGATDYAGGMNFGFSVFNRTATADGPCALFVGEALALHYPAGTEF